MKTNNNSILVAGNATGDLAASFNSDPYRIESFQYFSITATIAGSGSLNGTLKLQLSNDLGTDSGAGPSSITLLPNWIDVAASTQTITADGSVAWNYSGAGFRYVRIAYTKTAGTGSISFRVNAKGAL